MEPSADVDPDPHNNVCGYKVSPELFRANISNSLEEFPGLSSVIKKSMQVIDTTVHPQTTKTGSSSVADPDPHGSALKKASWIRIQKVK